MMHFYTEEECQFLRDNIKGTPYNQMAEMFNEKFGTNVGVTALKGKISKLKLKNGLNGCFEPNRTPWNKGKNFIAGGRSAETRFKKGQDPINWKPVGSERVSKDGYIEIKVSEPSEWMLKHRKVWEEANGEIPKGSIVVFKDSDRTNISLDNLALITRKENAVMNHSGMRYTDADMFETGLLLTKIKIKASDRRRADDWKNGG